MEREDNVFEGFDLTNLGEFSSFMEERDEGSSLNDGQNTNQQQAGDDDAFAGFAIEADLDEEPQGEENEDTSSSSDTKKPEKKFLSHSVC